MAGLLLGALLLLTGRTKAQIDTAYASAHSCNATCQQLLTTGITYETSQHVHQNDPFYEGPFYNGSRPAAPGQVLRLEAVTDLTNYTVPSALSMSRIIYTTEDFNGTVIPASAYVLWPHTPYVPVGKTYNGSNIKFQTVVWTHGTTGTHHNCAPSNYQNLQYNFMVPFEIARQGFAVVAPDYAGLGVHEDFDNNTIHHPWLLGPSQSNDAAYALTAARKAFSSRFSDDYVVMGHSQGGAVAWAYAQRQANTSLAVPGYLGTVTLAPGTDFQQLTTDAFAAPTNPQYAAALYGGIQQMLISAITYTFPAFNYTGLTARGLDLWNVLQNAGGCLPTQSLLIQYTGFVVTPGWQNTTLASKWFDIARNGGKPFASPLMVIASQGDETVPYDLVDTAVNTTCALAANKGKSLEFKTVQGLGHFPLISGSTGVWMNWIKARMEHMTADVQPGCKSSAVVPYGLNATKQAGQSTPNWLLQVPGATDSWKLSL